MPDPLDNEQIDRSRDADDIRPVLAGWPYHPEQISVRRITGRDGKDKIQLRLDLGLLQMATTGRPDGGEPHGFESLLHWNLVRLEEYKRRCGTDVGFLLAPEECELLREESVMYYQRYLSLFALGDYEGVEGDTRRNLQVLDMCRKYGAELADRLALEQYRPYIIMMNHRSAAMKSLQEGKADEALEAIDNGLTQIQGFFAEYGHADAFEQCREAQILRGLKQEIAGQLPTEEIEELQQQLLEAVRDERYEQAAHLRDEINKLISRAHKSQRDKAI